MPLNGQTPELLWAVATSSQTTSLMAAISTPRGPGPDGREGRHAPDEAAKKGNPAVGGPKTGARSRGVATEETIGGAKGGGAGTNPGVEAG